MYEEKEKSLPCIYSFRKPSQGFIALSMPDGILNDFKLLLEQLIKEILNADIPFTHNEQAEYCVLCNA